MPEQMNELLQKVDSLEKQISLVQNNVNFSIGLIWTILGVVVAIIGLALYFLIKMWFNKRFDEEVLKIDNKIKKFVSENPQILYAKGNCLSLSQNLIEGKCEYFIGGLINFKKDNVMYYDIYYVENNKKVSIIENQIEIEDRGIKIILIDKEKLSHSNNLQLNFVILWKNSLYTKNFE
ncbi:hypothetical protein ACJDU8_15820 [Clostridium sp. WILCCON 0269]|uniref:Uncharacterized protein n=1 Tax=Candidatus Clostridium eludens TaxID=3381663 RepID=A0ABW8SM27_9CLOT